MKKFTYEDFKKGLMLAGFIKPSNSQEAKEKYLLECYEDQKKRHPYIAEGDYVVSPYGSSPVKIVKCNDGLLCLEGIKPLHEVSRPLVKVNMQGWIKL